MTDNNEYCEKHCKGYRDTGGRCFADGRCDEYWEYQKQKGTMTEQDKKNERPDAVPASLSEGAVETKYKKGDHVWAKQPKELAGRTGYVMEADTRRMEYQVRFGTETWIVPEDGLELVDPATEEVRQAVFEREDDADQPLTEQAAYDEYQERSKTSGDASAVFADEEEQPKKKRPKILSMFYALLMCLFYVALVIGTNILSYKLFGLYCGIDSIAFSMAISIIWVLCYIHISED